MKFEWWYEFWQGPLGKVILEALRWAVLGALSLFIQKVLELIPGANLDPNFAFYLTAGLRFVDGLLHKSGVAQKGLTRF